LLENICMATHSGDVLVPSASEQMPNVSTGILKRWQSPWFMLVAAVVLYLICAFGLAYSRGPWYDEGFLVNPSYALITSGHAGVSILDDNGPFLPSPQRMKMKGIREHLYAEMPLHTLFLAAWFKLFGFGLLRARMFTILCGLIVLFSWYFVVRRVTMDVSVAITTFALTAIDYGFVLRASEARMDALSAAFGFGALAVYLALRERNLRHALFWSHTCVAASAFTHPNGGMLAFAGLAFLTLYYDFRRIRPLHLGIALAPYVIAVACWGVYIAQDFQSFKSQFRVASTQNGRLDTFRAPLTNLRQEIMLRYLGSLGGIGDASTIKKLKLVIPIAYWAAFLAVASIRSLRARKGYTVLLLLTAIYFFVLAFTDGRKSQCYTIHVIPLFVALLAIVIVWLWRKGQAYRAGAAAIVFLLCLIHVGGFVYQIRADSYHRSYLPAIGFLHENTNTDQSIIGPGILGLALQYPPNLTDDFRLGYLSGETPQWIVVNEWYDVWFRAMRRVEPDSYEFVKNRLDNEYTLVYDQAGFEIYRKR
jgi:4-amino-4-deoxy-L-arabinose transferase-like glycosyltransferase